MIIKIVGLITNGILLEMIMFIILDFKVKVMFQK
jgi:hypothetical protein